MMSLNVSGSAGVDADQGRRDSDVAVQIRPVRPAPRLPVLSDQQHTSTIRRSAPPIPPRFVVVCPECLIPFSFWFTVYPFISPDMI